MKKINLSNKVVTCCMKILVFIHLITIRVNNTMIAPSSRQNDLHCENYCERESVMWESILLNCCLLTDIHTRAPHLFAMSIGCHADTYVLIARQLTSHLLKF